MSRPALSSKESNVMITSKPGSEASSPSKRSTSSSPTKRVGGFSDSPSKRKPKTLGFKIFEDSQTISSEFNDLEIGGQENNNVAAKSAPVFDEQENILQPRLKTIKQRSMRQRKPLGDLNINEFKGYVEIDQVKTTLSEPFIPKNYKNESNSVHKFYSNYPSFISPAKNNRKYLFRSTSHDNEYNEDDEVEVKLLNKSMLIKHRRSYSLGKNDLKSHLIKKNNFTILTN